MQANEVRRSEASGPAAGTWLLPLLAVTALLQSLVTAASLWALVLFGAAAASGTLGGVLAVATTLVEALLRVGLHVLLPA